MKNNLQSAPVDPLAFLYKKVKSYAIASFVLYFLIMCLVICVIVSCACLTTESINASNAYYASNDAYYNALIDSYIAGIAASCGVCIFFIIVFEISALVINILGIVEASKIPPIDPHRSSIFILEIICLVLSFFIGLLAWIPAAVLLALVNKAIKENQSQNQVSPAQQGARII